MDDTKERLLKFVAAQRLLKGHFKRFQTIAQKYLSRTNIFDVSYTPDSDVSFRLMAFDTSVKVCYCLSINGEGVPFGKINCLCCFDNPPEQDVFWSAFFDEIGNLSEHSPLVSSICNILNPQDFEDILVLLLDNLLQQPFFKAPLTFAAPGLASMGKTYRLSDN